MHGMTHQGKESFRSSNSILMSFSGTTVTTMTFIRMIKGFSNGLSAGEQMVCFSENLKQIYISWVFLWLASLFWKLGKCQKIKVFGSPTSVYSNSFLCSFFWLTEVAFSHSRWQTTQFTETLTFMLFNSTWTVHWSTQFHIIQWDFQQ